MSIPDLECRPEKIAVAKAQLSTALALFIRDLDPFSVHSLACGACEILDGVVETHGIEAVSAWIRRDFEQGEIKRVRNYHWNAFKHFFDRNGKSARDDAERIRSFTDSENDSLLFQGWADLAALRVRLPVEAQIYSLWFMASDPSIFSEMLQDSSSKIFEFSESTSRQDRKRMLAVRCEEWRRNLEVMADPRTDPTPLLTAIQYE